MTFTSFMSEHTIEYALVSHLRRIFSERFGRIIPIYLWLTREGDNMALESIAGDLFSLIAVFARRPKVVSPDQETILVNFNSSVLRAAYEHRARGIPVFAGVPLLTSLRDFHLDVDCAWFEVFGQEEEDEDLSLELSLAGDLIKPIPVRSPIRGPIVEEEVARVASEQSKMAEWRKWVSHIRDARKALRDPFRSDFMWFGRAYRPFYLLLPSHR